MWKWSALKGSALSQKFVDGSLFPPLMQRNVTKTSSLAAPLGDVIKDPQTGQTLWCVGTLRYTKGGLVILFAWLMFNDFFLMLMEAVKPALNGILMRDNGATNTEIALYLGTLSAVFTIWINPVVSTASDRTRTRLGRRRPYLLAAAPPAALFLALIPWAPDGWRWLMGVPWVAARFGGGSISGAVLAIGVCSMIFSMFNAVLLSIFTYYFWDVVPKSLLGRFNAIGKIVTTIQSFIWNYWIFGLAEKHMHLIYAVLASLFLIAYVGSVITVKEGEYPPPEPIVKKNPLALIKGYFVDCFSESYYLWFFAGYIAYQVGNISNMYRIFHWNETLGLSLDTIGKMQAWPSLVIVLLGYPLGALVDRLNPMRVLGPSLLLWALCNVASFFFLRGATSLLLCIGAIMIASFIFGICASVATVEIFPREKIGQFCSANSISQQVFCFLITPLAGLFFDWIKDYTYVYLWSAVAQFLAAAIFTKVCFNWRHRTGLLAEIEPQLQPVAR
ncbi:MAG: MFS transporter [Chthoniobacterales bacterium]